MRKGCCSVSHVTTPSYNPACLSISLAPSECSGVRAFPVQGSDVRSAEPIGKYTVERTWCRSTVAQTRASVHAWVDASVSRRADSPPDARQGRYAGDRRRGKCYMCSSLGTLSHQCSLPVSWVHRVWQSYTQEVQNLYGVANKKHELEKQHGEVPDTPVDWRYCQYILKQSYSAISLSACPAWQVLRCLESGFQSLSAQCSQRPLLIRPP